MKEDIDKDKDIYAEIDRVYGSAISKEMQERIDAKVLYGNPKFLKEKSFKLYAHIKSTTIPNKLAKLFVEPIKTAEEVASLHAHEGSKKHSLLTGVLEKIYTGREYTFSDLKTEKQRKEVIKKNIFSARELMGREDEIDIEVEEIYKALMVEAKKDIQVLDGCIKLMKNSAFLNYIEILGKGDFKENISIDDKYALIVKSTLEIFDLYPDQAEEVVGILALYLSGDIKRVLELLEMRWGKTRVAIVLNHLLSLTSESLSLWFGPGKTLEDFLMQTYEANPMILSHHMTILGTQTLFNLPTNKYPLSLTDYVLPNLPVALRSGNFLMNPDKTSSMAPSERLSKTFQGDFNNTLEILKETTDEEFEDIIEQNKHIMGDSSVFFKDIPDTKGAISTARAIYIYIVKIAREGAIEHPSKNPELSKKINKVVSAHWNKYREESIKVGNLKSETLCIGKHSINSILDSTQESKNIKVEGHQFKIKIDHEVQIKSDFSMRDLASTRDAYIESFQLPSKAKGMEVEFPILNSQVVARNIKGRVQANYNSYQSIVKKTITKLTTNEIKELVSIAGVTTNSTDKKSDLALKIVIAEFSKELSSTILGDGSTVIKRDSKILSFRHKKEEAGLLNIKNSLETLIKKVEEEISTPLALLYPEKKREKFTEAVTDSLYQIIVRMVYFPSDTVQPIKDRLTLFVDKKAKDRGDISFELYRKKSDIELILPKKETKIEKESSMISTLIGARAVSTQQQRSNPATVQESEYYPSHAKMIIEEGKSSHIHIKELKNIHDDSLHISLIKDYIPNLTSSTLFIVNNKTVKPIGCISIDEVQQNTSTTALKKFRFLDNLGDNDKLVLMLAGSATSQQKKMAACLSQASPSDNILSSSILKRDLSKNCGIFKSSNHLLSFLVTEGGKVEGLQEVLHKNISRVIKKIRVLGKNTNLYKDIESFLEELEDPIIKEALQDFQLESSVHIDSHEMFGLAEEIIRGGAASILKDIRQEVTVQTAEEISKIKGSTASEEKKDIRDAAFNKIIRDSHFGTSALIGVVADLFRQGPGSGNYMAMPYVVEGINEAYISVKSNRAEYKVLDNYSGEELKEIKLKRGSEETPFKISTMLFAEAINKYRRQYSINAIARSYENMLEIAKRGIRENSMAVCGLPVTELNALMNPTTKDAGDGIDEAFKNMVEVKGEIPTEHEELIGKMIESIEFLIGKEKEINKIVRELDEDQKRSLEFLPGLFVEVKRTDVSGIVFTHPIGERQFKLKSDAGLRESNTIVLTKKGVEVNTFNKALKGVAVATLKYQTPVSIKPFEKLPSVDFMLGLRKKEEQSLLELASITQATKDLFLKHIDKGENTRVMTTRTVGQKLGLVCLVQALLERKDKSTVENILLNVGNKSIKGFAEKDLGTQKIKDRLNAANINIKHFITRDSKSKENKSVHDLIKESKATGAHMHIVSDMGSVAAGFDFSAIDVGFYYALVSNVEDATQSFARQNGNGKLESAFYLYLNHSTKKYTAPLKSMDELDRYMEEGFKAEGGERGEEQAKREMNSPRHPLELSKIKTSDDSVIIPRNKGVYKNFESFLTIQSGKVKSENFCTLTENERTEKHKDILSSAVLAGKSEEIPVEEEVKVSPLVPATPLIK